MGRALAWLGWPLLAARRRVARRNIDLCFPDLDAAARRQLVPFLDERPELERFITAVLQQDPRPAVHVRQAQPRDYAMFLYDLNIRWQVMGSLCSVTAVEKP